MRKYYSVVSPEYSITSGGIRVMYGLYSWLTIKGEVVLLNQRFDNTKDCIAIYPEIYHGNPLEAKTVVRYILNKPGIMANFGIPGPITFTPQDRIYVFSKLYDTFGVDENHLMFLPILNLHLFKAKKGKRKNRCVFVGKGRDIPLKETEGLPRITSKLSLDQGELAEFLNTCEIMYSFENPTAMNEIARLCGCRVVFIPEGANIKYSQAELKEKYEPGMMGISWGLKDYQKLDVEAFRGHYEALRHKFEEKLDIFIDDTQK